MTNQQLGKLLNKHCQVFKDELGLIKGTTTNLTIDTKAQLCFLTFVLYLVSYEQGRTEIGPLRKEEYRAHTIFGLGCTNCSAAQIQWKCENLW